ncbi:hypothetical protein [Motilimonas sp. E26]|uniref:hypothetical protein n=1 Tax=Motilimonas sp. E26 TaxID=2865674 RepID=UPI001E3B9669|nr:hypothetical protein [Motilimonas sp. E26]MCE0557323.1 hypothetical protein [Motilimonas sp. E26]
MNHNLVFSTLALSLALTACGGGGGGSSATDSNQGTTPPSVATPTPVPDVTPVNSVQVTVIDDYLQNALVWLDLNGDFIYQADEPSATTNEMGQATLTYPENIDWTEYHLVAKATAGATIDTRTGQAVTRDYYLTTPKQKSVITPLTSLVQGYVEQGETLENAEKLICQRVNAENCRIYDDYIATKADQLLGYSRAYMHIMPNGNNSIDFAIALDNAASVDLAMNNWLKDNNLNINGVNWAALNIIQNSLDQLVFSSQFSSAYNNGRNMVLLQLAGELHSAVADSIKLGLRQDWQIAETNIGTFNCTNGGTQTNTGAINSATQGGAGAIVEKVVQNNCSFYQGGEVFNSTKDFQSQLTRNAQGKLLSQTNTLSFTNNYTAGLAGIASTLKLTGEANYQSAGANYQTSINGYAKLSYKGENYHFSFSNPTNQPLVINGQISSGKIIIRENNQTTELIINESGWWLDGEKVHSPISY